MVGASEAGGSARTAADGVSDRTFRWGVVALGAAAFLIRWAIDANLASQTMLDIGGDGFGYLRSSAEFADGQGFVTARLLHPPLWTIVLGSARYLGLDDLGSIRMFTAALGVVTVVLIAVVGRKVVSPRAGLIAGAVAVVYPGLWVFERNLNAEALVSALIALSLLLAYRYLARPGLWAALAVALVIGLLAMTRSEQVLMVPFLLAPLVLTTAGLSWGRRIGRLALCGVVLLVITLPWTLVNLGEYERPILLSAGSGNAMVAGACDATFYGGNLGGFHEEQCVYPRPSFFIVDDTERDVAMRAEAVDYTRDNLGRLPVVVAARLGRTWGLYAQDQQAVQDRAHLNLPSTWSWAHVASFWVVGPLAVAGAVVLWRRRVRLYPLLAYPAAVVLSTVVTFGDARYRAPAEVSAVVLAGVAIDGAWGWWRIRGRRPTGAAVGGGDEAGPAGSDASREPVGVGAPGTSTPVGRAATPGS